MNHRASRNRTLTCSESEQIQLSREIMRLAGPVGVEDITGRVIEGDVFEVMSRLPFGFVDLLIVDPPYNLSKDFNGQMFKRKGRGEYRKWFEDVINLIAPTMKADATMYVCSDWETSTLIQPILEARFHVRNRITWEREKGRGSNRNWKNNTEDIWYCTTSANYYFDAEAVKLKRKVRAPYRADGIPKDWNQEESGKYRLTHASNIGTDITVPFWSMEENTDHPTQKPEKLLAKLILASSKAGDFVFDPFLGSGTTAVVAEKLERQWSGVEINKEYLCWALKRIRTTRWDKRVQGYSDGVFWERNTLSAQQKHAPVDGRQSSLRL